MTLAETLTSTAELVIELWHQPDTAQLEERRVQNAEDYSGRGALGGGGAGSLILIRTGNVYLGKVTVPLAHLLVRKTGRVICFSSLMWEFLLDDCGDIPYCLISFMVRQCSEMLITKFLKKKLPRFFRHPRLVSDHVTRRLLPSSFLFFQQTVDCRRPR